MSHGIHKWKVKLTGTSQTFVKEIGITSNLKEILRINKSEEELEEIGRFREIRPYTAACVYYDGNEGDILCNWNWVTRVKNVGLWYKGETVEVIVNFETNFITFKKDGKELGKLELEGDKTYYGGIATPGDWNQSFLVVE